MSYSIGEFAQMVGVSTSMLRYYETEGLLAPHRNEHNIREYSDYDVGWFQFLLHLKNTGMSLAELKQYTDWRSQGDDTIPERLDLLEQRKHLLELEIQALQQNMDVLNRKIVFYKDQLKGNKYAFVLYPKEKAES
ncbi:MerR family transcriptional regulator [Paenibacillus kribbensis]|uniref:MerR family transcriptional regulator n=1 Tax=Paenibacillus kribbensis TaxID=172713 RepID=UPI0008393C1F|nr:MerR family transcriptional regulator [Paenibacillus kribbensis]